MQLGSFGAIAFVLDAFCQRGFHPVGIGITESAASRGHFHRAFSEMV
jgi:hypothetical protein